MGAPSSKTGLLPREQKAVAVYCGNGQNKTDAIAKAGYSDPNARTSLVFNRPRVQRAIRSIQESLQTETITKKCVQRIKDNLNIQAPEGSTIYERVKVGYLHNDTITLVGKLRNEFSDKDTSSIPAIYIMGGINIDASSQTS